MNERPPFGTREVGNPVMDCDRPDVEFDCIDDEPPHLELDFELEPAGPAATS